MAEGALQTHSAYQQHSTAESPIRIDWATCHSESQTTSDETTSTSRDAFKTPPPRTVTSINKVAKGLSAVANGVVVSTNKRVYDIPTLLQYRGSLAGIAVFAKIKPDALAENLFQYIGANRPIKVPARSRGLSELSNPSHGIGTHGLSYPTFQARIAGLPQRQPQAPPDNSVIQQHEGFARFLKQHASPPHHRVTAGGRIVPAGPLSPPPMFDYASLTGMVRARSGKPPECESKAVTKINDFKPHNVVIQIQPSMSLPDHHASMNGFQAHGSFDHSSNGNITGPIDPGLQLSMSLVPVGTLEDGTTVASYNGLYYRTYWNGFGTFIEPLYNSSTQVSIGTQTEMDKRASSYNSHKTSESLAQVSEQRMPLRNTTNRSRMSSSQSQVSSQVRCMDSQQLDLNSTLRGLDKHLALHHYELSQKERASFIAKRKSLVEEIDKIRRVKDPSSQDLPVVNSRDTARRASGHSTLPPLGPQISLAKREANIACLNVPKDGKISKPLSPAAPPFIPGNMKVLAREPRDSPILPLHINSFIRASNNDVSSVDPTVHAQVIHDGPTDHFHQQDESLDRDLIDPAMRTIHGSDVTYAVRYLPERPAGEKQYCTTVSEFQEAVRQVRQQARLYGCAGGSSKDPAYDAEQDIWWAICDQDPIPLPPNVPDHVSNPRPWDWTDSVFNYRRGSGLPIINVGVRGRSSSGSTKWNENVTHKAQKDNDTRRLHTFTRKLPSVPPQSLSHEDHGARLGEEAEIIPEAVPETIPATLDREYMAVQNAIDALNRRSKAIMEQAKHLSGFSRRNPIDHNADRGTSRFQLASQNYAQDAQHRHTGSIRSANGLQAYLDVPSVAVIQANSNTGQRKVSVDAIPKGHDLSGSQRPNGGHHLSFSPQTSSVTSQNIVVNDSNAGSRRASTSRGFTQKSFEEAPNSSSAKPQPQKLASSATSEERMLRPTKPTADMKPAVKGSIGGGQLDLFSRTKQQLSPRKAARKAKELYERSKSRTPQKRQGQKDLFSTPTGPRVNLPSYTNSQLKDRSSSLEASADTRDPQLMSNDFHSNEVKAITVTGPSSDTFLRDMLKGSRYSSSQPAYNRAQAKRLNKPKMNTILRDGSTVMKMKKENTAVPRSTTAVLGDSLSNLNRLPVVDKNSLLAGKAASSLAASAYNASGYLPQYDGAGKAHTSTVHQQHGVPVSHRQAKVNLPHRSSYDEHPTSHGLKSYNASAESTESHNKHTHWSSTPFGLDGSEDTTSASEGYTTASQWKGKGKQKEFDSMGVTRADFDQQRADPNNAWHHGEVTDLFNEIADQENAYMTTRKRQNTKTE